MQELIILPLLLVQQTACWLWLLTQTGSRAFLMLETSAGERGVARIYQMALDGGVWKMWRESPDFSQRMMGAFSEDGNTITAHGELSSDGLNWEQDLDVTYTRKTRSP